MFADPDNVKQSAVGMDAHVIFTPLSDPVHSYIVSAEGMIIKYVVVSLSKWFSSLLLSSLAESTFLIVCKFDVKYIMEVIIIN